MLKALKANYTDALSEINDRIAMLLGRADADMQHVIYQVEYQKAVKNHVQGILDTLNTNNFESVSEYLTKSYEDGFVGAMYDMQGQGVPLILPIDQEQVVDAIQHETKLSEGLYAALGKDTKVLSKQIASEISRGISNAATYSEISRNIAGYAGISRNNAMRIARTESHRIQNKSINDAQQKAKDKGADLVKIWSAALDGKTRETHRKLDGQIREMDEPFEVDGLTAMYPGDFGDPAEDCNCRCRCNSKARWLLDEPITKWSPDAPIEISDDGTTQLFKIEAKDYESFKEQYNQATEKIQNSLENIGKSSTIYSDKEISSYIENPKTLGNTTHKEKYDDFIEHGVDVKPLNRGSLKGIDYEDGGGYKVNGTKDGQYLQYHPEVNSHHSGEYYKLSSGKAGTRRYDMDGNLIED